MATINGRLWPIQAALIQTYATADGTNAALTATAGAAPTATSAGVGAVTVSTTAVATTASVDTALATLNTLITNLINDHADTKQFVNTIADQLQLAKILQ